MSYTQKSRFSASPEKLRYLVTLYTHLLRKTIRCSKVQASLDGICTLPVYHNPHLAHLTHLHYLPGPYRPPESEIFALHLYSPSLIYSHSPRTCTPGTIFLAPNPSPSWWVTLTFTCTTHPKSLQILMPMVRTSTPAKHIHDYIQNVVFTKNCFTSESFNANILHFLITALYLSSFFILSLRSQGNLHPH